MTDASPLTPVRRHIIASILHVFPTLLLYQHLVAPNLFIFLARVSTQSQCSTPRHLHPGINLRIWVMSILFLNTVAILLHSIDIADGDDGKGILLDFVGIKNKATPFTIISLDILLTFIQLVTVYIAYLSDSPSTLFTPSHGQVFIESFTQDPLLPDWHGEGRIHSKAPSALAHTNGYLGRQEEEGLIQGNEDNGYRENGLDENSYPPTRMNVSSNNSLILNITMYTFLRTILLLPSPPPPPRAFAGGTPNASDLDLSRIGVVDSDGALTMTRVVPDEVGNQEEEDEWEDEEGEGEEEEDERRMPGGLRERSRDRSRETRLHTGNWSSLTGTRQSIDGD